MELVITPTLCKQSKDESGADVAPLFSGSVTVKVPTMPQSYKMKAKFGKKTIGLTDSGDKNTQAFATMELLADIAEDIQSYFVAVDLTELSTNKKIQSVDDLYCYEPAFAIVSEVAMKFIQGFVEKE
jgi:hypothetical protein